MLAFFLDRKLTAQRSSITRHSSSVIIRQASQVKAQRTTLDQIPGQRLRGGHVAAGQPPGRGKAKRNIQLNRDRKTVTRGRPRAGPIFEFPREEDSGLDDQTLKERLAGGRRINCETVEERCLATNLLLKMGYRHGKTGYSKKYCDPSNQDRSYMCPYVSNGAIEYWGGSAPNGIPFEEIAQVPSKSIPSLDDLI